MASSKALFLRNKEDVKSALEFTKSPIYEKMIAFARAEFSEQSPTREQSEGARNFINILSNLADEESEPEPWIESGLKHDLSVPPRDGKKPETK